MRDSHYRKWERKQAENGYAGVTIEERLHKAIKSGLDLVTESNKIVYGLFQSGEATDDAMCDVLTMRAMHRQGVMGRMMHNEKFLLESYLVANLIPYSDLGEVKSSEELDSVIRIDVFLKDKKGYIRWISKKNELMVTPFMENNSYDLCDEIREKIPVTPLWTDEMQILWKDVTLEVLAELLV